MTTKGELEELAALAPSRSENLSKHNTASRSRDLATCPNLKLHNLSQDTYSSMMASFPLSVSSSAPYKIQTRTTNIETGSNMSKTTSNLTVATSKMLQSTLRAESPEFKPGASSLNADASEFQPSRDVSHALPTIAKKDG